MAAVTRPCAALALLAVAGCVIDTPDEPLATRTEIERVDVSPATATVEAGGAQQFTGTVTGTGVVPQAIVWSVRPSLGAEPAGAIDDTGRYRVVAPPRSDARDYVVATSAGDASVRSEAPVDVPAVSVTVTPRGADVLLYGELSFAADVRGLASKDVSWSCTYGIIDEHGRYVASDLNARDTVLARPKAAPSEFGYASLQIGLPPPVLTGASAPLKRFTTMTFYGSGFLPLLALGRQLLLEDTSGYRGGTAVQVEADDRFTAFIPGGDFTGRVSLKMWGGDGPDPFPMVESNALVIPVAP